MGIEEETAKRTASDSSLGAWSRLKEEHDQVLVRCHGRFSRSEGGELLALESSNLRGDEALFSQLQDVLTKVLQKIPNRPGVFDVDLQCQREGMPSSFVKKVSEGFSRWYVQPSPGVLQIRKVVGQESIELEARFLEYDFESCDNQEEPSFRGPMLKEEPSSSGPAQQAVVDLIEARVVSSSSDVWRVINDASDALVSIRKPLVDWMVKAIAESELGVLSSVEQERIATAARELGVDGERLSPVLAAYVPEVPEAFDRASAFRFLSEVNDSAKEVIESLRPLLAVQCSGAVRSALGCLANEPDVWTTKQQKVLAGLVLGLSCDASCFAGVLSRFLPDVPQQVSKANAVKSLSKFSKAANSVVEELRPAFGLICQTPLQSVLDSLAGEVWSREEGKAVQNLLNDVLKLSQLRVKCEACQGPALLSFSRVSTYQEWRWRYVHYSPKKNYHGSFVAAKGGVLSAGSPEFPSLALVSLLG